MKNTPENLLFLRLGKTLNEILQVFDRRLVASNSPNDIFVYLFYIHLLSRESNQSAIRNSLGSCRVSA